eukprot:PhM_4_TR2851/c1_g1_i1/m.31448
MESDESRTALGEHALPASIELSAAEVTPTSALALDTVVTADTVVATARTASFSDWESVDMCVGAGVVSKSVLGMRTVVSSSTCLDRNSIGRGNAPFDARLCSGSREMFTMATLGLLSHSTTVMLPFAALVCVMPYSSMVDFAQGVYGYGGSVTGMISSRTRAVQRSGASSLREDSTSYSMRTTGLSTMCETDRLTLCVGVAVWAWVRDALIETVSVADATSVAVGFVRVDVELISLVDVIVCVCAPRVSVPALRVAVLVTSRVDVGSVIVTGLDRDAHDEAVADWGCESVGWTVFALRDLESVRMVDAVLVPDVDPVTVALIAEVGVPVVLCDDKSVLENVVDTVGTSVPEAVGAVTVSVTSTEVVALGDNVAVKL